MVNSKIKKLLALITTCIVVFAGSSVAFADSWVQDPYDSDTWYYWDNNGYCYTGWKYINGDWYFFNLNTGKMQTGWLLEDIGYTPRWYYLGSDGAMLSSEWEKINGKWYYFMSSGVMDTGWLQNSGKTYYLDDNSGAMVTGWKKIGRNWYYFDNSGAMVHDEWLYSGNEWYYLNGSGAMITGWHVFDKTDWHYLGVSSEGEFYTNAIACYFDGSGAWDSNR